MSRFSRINTVWRKELIDTLRDRRTVTAMLLVPMVLYPALMLGSLQALEVQVSYLVAERYDIGVPDDDTQRWLRRLIDSDAARRGPDQGAAEDRVAASEGEAASKPGISGARQGGQQAARMGVRHNPPEYRIFVVDDPLQEVLAGRVNCGVMLRGPPPGPDEQSSTQVSVLFDESDIRSEIAASGVSGVVERAAERMLAARLRDRDLRPEFIAPLALEEKNIATAERMTGSVLGQIIPLILVMMTFTGAIYPAIDLTAGERERGTLETLMVTPTPTVELIAGKFIVVTLIGLMSAALNLLSIGGTIYLGGVGSVLAPGADLQLPLTALPWILLMLVPLAVLFSAMLLAVCSFARSFKEAQNYVLPVMVAAMIPGVVGILPGTRLEGPILIMPVANIVVMAKELFLGKMNLTGILWVVLSTSLYAGAAVAVAAKLFGQEAVLFADAGSVKTIFQRRHFRPRVAPSAATALLVLAVVYSLNFYVQNGFSQAGLHGGTPLLAAIAMTLAVLFVMGPWLAARYMRVEPQTAFSLAMPSRGAAWGAATCFGLSTWVLALAWAGVQANLFKMDAATREAMRVASEQFTSVGLPSLIFYLALVPALCEELFFRGFVLSGVRTSLGKAASVLVVALAFGLSHHSAHRLPVTVVLGLMLGLLVVQFGSVWPAILAHFLHNGITVIATSPDGLMSFLLERGVLSQDGTGHVSPAPMAVMLAGVAVTAGVGLCWRLGARGESRAGMTPAAAM